MLGVRGTSCGPQTRGGPRQLTSDRRAEEVELKSRSWKTNKQKRLQTKAATTGGSDTDALQKHLFKNKRFLTTVESRSASGAQLKTGFVVLLGLLVINQRPFFLQNRIRSRTD